ncbi:MULTISPECIES: hypothetical protein [Paraburkholderia]|uniref:hypothetical protein n=1 Tax=Paraburkholderia TaxID=1822464 RepID=UPI00207DBFD5|nr:hypothetical protein [Paraburkholderia terrae]GJH00454.1 hypothetical protein CBA19C8_07875 [Paraburkholderia terrae]
MLWLLRPVGCKAREQLLAKLMQRGIRHHYVEWNWKSLCVVDRCARQPEKLVIASGDDELPVLIESDHRGAYGDVIHDWVSVSLNRSDGLRLTSPYEKRGSAPLGVIDSRRTGRKSQTFTDLSAVCAENFTGVRRDSSVRRALASNVDLKEGCERFCEWQSARQSVAA